VPQRTAGALIAPGTARWQLELFTFFNLLKLQSIGPIVARRFSLCEPWIAHDMLEVGGATGTIVLAIAES
jgi:hypothetical protein